MHEIPVHCTRIRIVYDNAETAAADAAERVSLIHAARVTLCVRLRLPRPFRPHNEFQVRLT